MSEEAVEIVEHTADWSIRVRAENLAQLFAHAARGLTMLMVENPQAAQGDEPRIVELAAYDAEALLVDWLSELAYWAESELLVAKQIDVIEIGDQYLAASIRVGKVQFLDKHIKAVTYHNLAINESSSGFEVTIVFDV